jgi:hypothetical protein
MQRVFLVNVNESWLELHKLFGLKVYTGDYDNEEAWYKVQAFNAQQLLEFMRGEMEFTEDELSDVSFIMYGYTGGETFQHRQLKYSVNKLIMEMVSTVTARMKNDFKTTGFYRFNEHTINTKDSLGSNTTLQKIRNIGFIYDIDNCWTTMENKFTGEADFHFQSAQSDDASIWNQVQLKNTRQVRAFMLRKFNIKIINGVLKTDGLPPKYTMLSNLIRLVSQVMTKLSTRLRRRLLEFKDEISPEDHANATKVLQQIEDFKVEKPFREVTYKPQAVKPSREVTYKPQAVKPSRKEIYKKSIKRIRNLMVQNAIAKITDILGLMEMK